MGSSGSQGECEGNVDKSQRMRELRLGGVPQPTRVVDLRTLDFVGYVSEEAREEIKKSEVRAGLVLTTATNFAFR